MADRRKRLTKREAKKRACLSAATLIDEACSTEIFEGQGFDKDEVSMLLDAMQELAASLYARAEK